MSKAVRDLTDKAVPGFSEGIALQRSLRKIDEYLYDLSSADKPETINRLEILLSQERGELSRLINEIYFNDIANVSSLSLFEARKKWTILSDSSKLYIKNIRNKLQFINSLERSVGEFNAVFDELMLILEELTRKTNKILREDLSHTASNPESVQENIKHLMQFNALLNITHEIAFIKEIVNSADQLNNIATYNKVEKNLAFYFTSTALKISSSLKGDERRALGSKFIEMRSQIFKRDGFFNNAKQYYQLESAQSGLHNELNEILNDLSVLTNNSVALARDQVQTASREVKNSIENIVLIIILSTAIAFILIAITNIILIERDVHRRLTKLIRTVRNLANGNTDVEITVTGKDELADMASALIVFKANAIELQRSNTELEDFAYAAAHDLRSPLRAIGNLTEWIIEDEENEFSEESQEYLDLLKSRLTRLDKLLTDLLQYARAGRVETDVEELSIAETVAEFADMLDGQNKYNISFSGTCDVITTHTTPFRQILLNLISNAIKHHDRPEGHITVKAHSSSHEVYLTVQDDGAGIEKNHQERIFELFKTLKSRDDVEGSGLGLSMVKKLVEYHGGKIEVNSDPEKERGTSFHFTLPLLSSNTAQKN